MGKSFDSVEYEKLLQELEKKYDENPEGTVRELRNTIKALNYSNTRMNARSSTIRHFDDDSDKDFHMLNFDYYSSQIFVYIVALIVLAFMFLFHIGGENFEDGLALYLFGSIFLAAGQSIGTFVPFFGLIFLFSHGGTGMGLMVSTFLSPILENPVMTDNPPQGLILYIGTALALIVIGFLVTVVRNLSNTFKEKYYSVFLPVVFYIVGMGMIVVLYRNFDVIYKMMM